MELYSTRITDWRKLRDASVLAGKKAGQASCVLELTGIRGTGAVADPCEAVGSWYQSGIGLHCPGAELGYPQVHWPIPWPGALLLVLAGVLGVRVWFECVLLCLPAMGVTSPPASFTYK